MAIFLLQVLSVLCLESLLHVFETPLNVCLDVLCVCLLQVFLTEKLSVLVSDEVKHHAGCKAGHFLPVDAMTIKNSKNLDFSVDDDEQVVLVVSVDAALFARELYVFVLKYFLMLP